MLNQFKDQFLEIKFHTQNKSESQRLPFYSENGKHRRGQHLKKIIDPEEIQIPIHCTVRTLTSQRTICRRSLHFKGVNPIVTRTPSMFKYCAHTRFLKKLKIGIPYKP